MMMGIVIADFDSDLIGGRFSPVEVKSWAIQYGQTNSKPFDTRVKEFWPTFSRAYLQPWRDSRKKRTLTFNGIGQHY